MRRLAEVLEFLLLPRLLEEKLAYPGVALMVIHGHHAPLVRGLLVSRKWAAGGAFSTHNIAGVVVLSMTAVIGVIKDELTLVAETHDFKSHSDEGISYQILLIWF